MRKWPRHRINHTTTRRSVPIRFFIKAFNDWIFEFAGLLAYYLLLATVPVFLLLLGGVGFVLQRLNPATVTSLREALAHTLPSQISRNLIDAVTSDLKSSSITLLLVGLISALLFGSRLIVRMDECFTVIYRERPRPFLKQNLIGLGLTALFVILAPIMFLAAAIPSFLTTAVAQVLFHHTQPPGVIGQIVGFAGGYLAAFLWMLAIYILVPSRHVGLRNSWPGAALAALLLIIYELIFPWIASVLLHPGKYGETAGFFILLLSFFYYFAFLLLLGAEVNSWLAGHRETLEDLPTMLHQAIIHGELPELPADASSPSMKAITGPTPPQHTAETPAAGAESVSAGPESAPTRNGASASSPATQPPEPETAASSPERTP